MQKNYGILFFRFFRLYHTTFINCKLLLWKLESIYPLVIYFTRLEGKWGPILEIHCRYCTHFQKKWLDNRTGKIMVFSH